ncbi:MAG: DNA polymerase I [Lentisphaerae bacterium]|jgi:DNA polymerase-1|nr:DNA polymerase I [Lentisphaerota bacterium]
MKKETSQKLVALDVMPLLYRGHFAFINRPRMTSSGINTSAIYIFSTLVLDMLQDADTSHIVLAMDTSPTFRHDKYPEYKAQRDKLPEDIAASIPMAEEFAKAVNIPFLKVDGYEADDLMGTLAAMGEKAGIVTWLVTPDKDMAQLVTPTTLLCRPGTKGTNELYDEERVRKEWGLKEPSQMIDFLGLSGDASDNIPGIPGVGPKTASKLLADYGSLDNVIANAADLKGKLSERVAENADKAIISRWLAEIRKDVPLNVTIEEFAKSEPDLEAIREFCGKYELRTVFNKIFPGVELYSQPAAGESGENIGETAKAGERREKLQRDAVAGRSETSDTGEETEIPGFRQIGDVAHKYILCDTEEKVDMLVDRLKRSTKFAFDTETAGLDPRNDKIVGLSFAIVPHSAYYVPINYAAILEESADVDLLPLFSSERLGKYESSGEAEPGKMDLFSFSGLEVDGSTSTMEHQAAEDEERKQKQVVAEQGEDKVDEGFLAADRIAEKFGAVFADPSIMKIGHNLKFDMHVLRSCGVEVAGSLADTMLAHYVLDSVARHGMDPLAREYLAYDPISINTLIGERGKNQLTMDQVPVDKIADYAAEDADITIQLYNKLIPSVRDAGAEDAFEKCENELIPVLLDMETDGVKINVAALHEYGIELAGEISEIEQRVYKLSGQEFNIASSKQLGDILFGVLRLPSRGKTPKGQYSTGEEVLLNIVDEHPVVKEVLEYRTCAKLKSTYVDKLPKFIDSRTGRIHTSFNQALTETGRLSSDNPNLQNIPIRTERGRRIRETFIPGKSGNLLISADYSQIELRMMASFSGDESMIHAFENDADIHLETASRVFNVPLVEVTREMRSECKMVNFGIIYGISAFGLAQRLGTTRSRADELIKTYFELYPSVKRYMETTVREARDKGYVTTIMGRRRPLRDINSRNAMLRSGAERVAINTPVQGSAADLIKLAMVAVHKELAKRKLQTRLILQVHDELVFDAPEDEVEEVSEMVKSCMTSVMELKVPLKVDIGTGTNWLEAL